MPTAVNAFCYGVDLLRVSQSINSFVEFWDANSSECVL
jgi:hypothetical protein